MMDYKRVESREIVVVLSEKSPNLAAIFHYIEMSIGSWGHQGRLPMATNHGPVAPARGGAPMQPEGRL